MNQRPRWVLVLLLAWSTVAPGCMHARQYYFFGEKDHRPVNGVQSADFLAPQRGFFSFQRDLGTFRAELSKTAATGTQFFARHNAIYDFDNNPSREIPNDWTINYEFGVRQPLL